jgi:hypothetical protein
MKQLIILIIATFVIFNSYSKSCDDEISKICETIGIADNQDQDNFEKKLDKPVNFNNGKKILASKIARQARRIRRRAGRVDRHKMRLSSKIRKTRKQFKRAAKNAKRR